jgi:hypothetical protein
MGAREDLLAIPDDVLREGRVGEAVLTYMDFGNGAKRWWTGWGDLVVAGHMWQGLGDMIGISDVSNSYSVAADSLTFALAATPEMVALVRQSGDLVRGRAVVVYTQLFAVQPDDGSMPWQPLGGPMALFTGTMENMTFAAQGPSVRQISLQCESVFARRNQPPRGVLTDKDQKARSVGDRGCERVPLYENYETKWI